MCIMLTHKKETCSRLLEIRGTVQAFHMALGSTLEGALTQNLSFRYCSKKSHVVTSTVQISTDEASPY
jgi:hypothetical protein